MHLLHPFFYFAPRKPSLALKCKNQKNFNDHGSSRQKIGHNA